MKLPQLPVLGEDSSDYGDRGDKAKIQTSFCALGLHVFLCSVFKQ